MKTVLVTGATGLLGSKILQTGPSEVALHGISRSACRLQGSIPAKLVDVDVRDPVRIEEVFVLLSPEVVIHTASIGSVDFAEKNQAEAYAVEFQGTKIVGEAALRHGSRFIYISSNAVFNGENPPYAEGSPTRPINYYGRLKVMAEQWVENSGLVYSIIRPILMYGWPTSFGRDNLVTRWKQCLEKGRPIKVVDSVFSKPLLVTACAAAIWAIVEQERTGVYHIAGADRVSLYEFALLMARVFGLNANLIEPVPDSFFSSMLAPRPRDTSFSTRKMELDLGLKPIKLLDGLNSMKSARPDETQV